MNSSVRLIKIFFQLTLSGILFFSISCKTTQTTQKTPVKPQPVQPPGPKKEDVTEVKEVKKEELTILKVALILPFELEANFAEVTDETVEPEINPASLNALNFYEGALLAADSLKSKTKEVKIQSYDTPADSAGILRMMTSTAIKDASIVIGTFPNNLINAAITGAKKAGINLILTQAGSPDLLDNNKNIALSYASTITQCREMALFMMKQFPNSNVIMVYRNLKREEELAGVFRTEIQKLKQQHDFTELNATLKSYKEITGMLSKTKRNVIFLISSDEAFVSPVISLVEEQNIFGITIAGLPTWQNFESIDFMALKNVQVNLFDNNFIDYENSDRISFRKNFISKYANDPMNSSYNGFDLIYNLGRTYEKKDQDFLKWIHKSFPEDDINYSFKENKDGGIENKAISVLKFTDYRLERINSK